MDQIQPNSYFSFTVPESNADSRLDIYITQQFSQYSRNYFKHLIVQELVKINNIVTKKQGTLVKTGDKVTIQFPPKPTLTTTTQNHINLAVTTLYKQEHFLIISKPAGLLVHPPFTHCTEATLVDWLVANHSEIQAVGSPDRPGIIHRLDKNTSGLLIIPRTNYAHTIFGQQFKDRTIKKKYYALVEGHPEKKGSIDLPIGRDPITRTRMKAFSVANFIHTTKKIRSATTHYKVVTYFDNYSLIEVKPITGRTHQIRVHCAAIRHPIVGDPIYGKKSPIITRQALHAQELSFTFNNRDYSFSAELPNDFKNALKIVDKKNNL